MVRSYLYLQCVNHTAENENIFEQLVFPYKWENLNFSKTRRLTNNFKTVLELSGQELTFLYYEFSHEILSLLNPLFNYLKTYAFICN